MTTKKQVSVIRFQAQVWSVKTTVDGGVNITLAISSKEVEVIGNLLECKNGNALLEVAAVPIKPEKKPIVKNVNSQSKRTKRYPYKD